MGLNTTYRIPEERLKLSDLPRLGSAILFFPHDRARMAAAQSITLDKFITFLSVTNGKDKLLKIAQYGSRVISWSVCERPPHLPSLASLGLCSHP